MLFGNNVCEIQVSYSISKKPDFATYDCDVAKMLQIWNLILKQVKSEKMDITFKKFPISDLESFFCPSLSRVFKLNFWIFFFFFHDSVDCIHFYCSESIHSNRLAFYDCSIICIYKLSTNKV